MLPPWRLLRALGERSITKPPIIAFVVAAAENGVIGRAGRLPWRIPADLKTFRRLTLGKPVIMGRKTFQSLKEPLDDRDNIVVTREPGWRAPNVHTAASIEAALELGRRLAAGRGTDEVMVIGGSEIYRAALALADKVYLTLVHGRPDGDTVLPPLPPEDWKEVSRQPIAPDPRDEYACTLTVLERRRGT